MKNAPHLNVRTEQRTSGRKIGEVFHEELVQVLCQDIGQNIGQNIEGNIVWDLIQYEVGDTGKYKRGWVSDFHVSTGTIGALGTVRWRNCPSVQA